MLNSLPINLIIGSALGFLSGLGIGGGSLLVLWLTVVLGMEPQIARSINLLFFIPAAVLSCILRIQNGELKIKPLLPAMVAGSISSALFSWVSTVVDVSLLKKGFGILLIAAGLRELGFKAKEKGSSK